MSVFSKIKNWFLSPSAQLDAGSTDWRNLGFHPFSSSADKQFFLSDPKLIVNRSRQLCANDPLLSSIQTRMANQQIRNGIQPQFKFKFSPKPDVNLTKNIKWLDSFLEWANGFDRNGHFFADSAGIRSYWVIQHLMRSDKFSDGGMLVHRVYDDSIPGVCPLRLEVLEIDHIDSTRDGLHKDGSETVNGFKYSRAGKRLGVWLLPKHPSGNGLAPAEPSKFIKEADYIYYFRPRRSSQRIGRPETTPAIQLANDLHVYQDHTLQKSKLEAQDGGWIKNAPDGLDLTGMSTPTGSRVTSPVAGDDYYPSAFEETGLAGTNTIQIGGLTVRAIPKGTDYVNNEQKNPGPQYQEFVKNNGRRVAVSSGVSDQIGTGNYSDTTFSGARSAALDQSIDFSVEQFFLGEMVLGKIHAWFVDSMVISGLEPVKLRNYMVAPWKYWLQIEPEFPGFRSFNRHQDMTASEKALEMHLSNVVVEAAVEGGNAYKNLEENTKFEQAKKAFYEAQLENAKLAAEAESLMNIATNPQVNDEQEKDKEELV